MATAYEMPLHIRTRKFDLDYVQQLSPSGNQGFIQTLNRGQPFWRGEFATAPLTEPHWQDMTYFKDMLEGSMNTFLAYDPRRPMPYAYNTQPTTNDPWTQTGQTAPRITAFDYSASTLSLDRLATGAVITIGDYISAQIAGIWYLFRAMQTLTVAGNTATVLVKPRPNIVGFATTNIRYRKACCEMKVIGKFDETDSVEDKPAMTWRGVQYTARVASVIPGTFLVGNNAAQTTNSAVAGDVQQGVIAQAALSGTANTICIVGAPSTLSGVQYRLTVYSASSGTAISGPLLGQSADQTVLNTGVNSFLLQSPINIVAGNWYALMLHAGTWSGSTGTAANGTIGDKWFSDTYSDGPLNPAPAGGVNSANGRMIYLTT